MKSFAALLAAALFVAVACAQVIVGTQSPGFRLEYACSPEFIPNYIMLTANYSQPICFGKANLTVKEYLLGNRVNNTTAIILVCFHNLLDKPLEIYTAMQLALPLTSITVSSSSTTSITNTTIKYYYLNNQRVGLEIISASSTETEYYAILYGTLPFFSSVSSIGLIKLEVLNMQKLVRLAPKRTACYVIFLLLGINVNINSSIEQLLDAIEKDNLSYKLLQYLKPYAAAVVNWPWISLLRGASIELQLPTTQFSTGQQITGKVTVYFNNPRSPVNYSLLLDILTINKTVLSKKELGPRTVAGTQDSLSFSLPGLAAPGYYLLCASLTTNLSYSYWQKCALLAVKQPTISPTQVYAAAYSAAQSIKTELQAEIDKINASYSFISSKLRELAAEVQNNLAFYEKKFSELEHVTHRINNSVEIVKQLLQAINASIVQLNYSQVKLSKELDKFDIKINNNEKAIINLSAKFNFLSTKIKLFRLMLRNVSLKLAAINASVLNNSKLIQELENKLQMLLKIKRLKVELRCPKNVPADQSFTCTITLDPRSNSYPVLLLVKEGKKVLESLYLLPKNGSTAALLVLQQPGNYTIIAAVPLMLGPAGMYVAGIASSTVHCYGRAVPSLATLLSPEILLFLAAALLLFTILLHFLH
ncbi:MAG: hypothetical protein GXO42_01800 [bacterium]|nr:hypothetical protein [bacterium]